MVECGAVVAARQVQAFLAVPHLPVDDGFRAAETLGQALQREAGLGFLLWIAILRFLPAGTASLNMFAIPVIALVSSALVFGERLTAGEWAGIALIGAGLAIVTAIARILLGLGLRVGLAIAVIGLADALYQRWQYIQELKMTRQEVKQEHKDLEGAPEIKARIRRIQVEMSMRRLRQEVPKASVILVNPTHVAVALRYEPRTMDAPILLVKGADHMAERIVSIARAYGVPIVRRPEVARAIYASVKPGRPIPEALYVAVAEVLFLLELETGKRGRALRQTAPPPSGRRPPPCTPA